MTKRYITKSLAKRVLKSTNSDVWGYTAAKKKFNKDLQKILIIFENRLRRDIINEFKKDFMQYPRFKNAQQQKPQKLTQTDSLFTTLFQNYYSYRIKTKFNSTLLNAWNLSRILRLKRSMSRRLFFLNKDQYFDIGKRLPRVRGYNYIQQKRIELLKLQEFYCFKHLSTVRRFLRSIEFNKSTWNYRYGFASMLAHMLFRLNLFPTMKFCYTFIKLGAVQINNKPVTNPFRSVNLFDTISIKPTYIKFVFYYFIARLKRREIMVNIPSFFDYDYKLMRFFIWRPLTSTEQYFSFEYPFQRTSLYDPTIFFINTINYRKNF